MKRLLLIPAAVALLSFGAAAPASAGCVTGAIVGGIAGHMVGHGGVGAAAGCAYGAHRSNKAKAERMDTGRSSATDANTNRNR
jgi:uncharacterized protein YcfJ